MVYALPGEQFLLTLELADGATVADALAAAATEPFARRPSLQQEVAPLLAEEPPLSPPPPPHVADDHVIRSKRRISSAKISAIRRHEPQRPIDEHLRELRNDCVRERHSLRRPLRSSRGRAAPKSFGLAFSRVRASDLHAEVTRS